MARELKGERLEKELARLEAMRAYEREYGDFSLICGIDEAGRGPLAGPVTAGAVILPKDCQILYLNDSKKLSEKRREELFTEIKEKAVAWCVKTASPARIDEINILQATYEAMREAIAGLGVVPQLLFKRCGEYPTGGNFAGAYHKRRCQKRVYCGSQYPCKGDKGSHDGRI